MSKAIDMTNQKYGFLTVLYRVENDKHGKAQWMCQCDCGSPPKVINGAAIRKGLVVSCGCHKAKKIQEYNESKIVNEVGNIYGYLKVISRNTNPAFSKDGRAMWNCECKCGKTHVVSGKLLRSGKVTSCGCRVQSLGEEVIEKLLLLNNFLYSKEYLIYIENNYKRYFDFAIMDKNNKLQYFIEYDGEQHFTYKKDTNSTWNNKENYLKTVARDKEKNQWCKNNNIPLIRIPYTHLEKITIEDLMLETSNFIVS